MDSGKAKGKRMAKDGTARRSSAMLGGLIVAVSMTTIDQTIVSVSSQTVQSGLGLNASAIEWVVNAYLLAAAAVFPLGGKLADSWGYRRVMLAGIAVFAAGSLLCGATPAGPAASVWMISSRVVQGAGSALMFPAAVGILVSGSTREGRAKAMALFFAITGAMTSIGPVAGAWLIAYSWRWVFFINLPLALVSFLMVLLLADRDGARGDRIDWRGAAVSAAAMVLFILPLKRGGQDGWTDPRILASFAASLLLFAWFFAMERRTSRPLVDTRMLAHRPFALSALATLVASAVFIPIMYFLSVYGQLSLGLAVGRSSLLILGFFAGFMIAAQVGARLFDRRGIAAVLAVGGAMGAVGFYLLSRRTGGLASGVPAMADLMPFLALAGAGIGFMFSPAATDMVNRVAEAAYGEATSISQTMKNLGGALGMAALSSLSLARFAHGISEGLTDYGVSPSRARHLAAHITSGQASSGEGLNGLAPAVRRTVMDTVREAYAGSMHGVFLAMGAACLSLVLIAALYPRVRGGRPARARAHHEPASPGSEG